MGNDTEKLVFYSISELHLDGKVLVEDVMITGFVLPQFIDEENRHGNLDVLNALANYIIKTGTSMDRFRLNDESNEKKRVYKLTNLPKLSIYHKYYSVDVKFSVYVSNGKLVLSRGVNE